MKALFKKVQQHFEKKKKRSHFKQTKDEKGLSLNQEIRFECICAKLGHRKSELVLKEDDSFKFLEGFNASKMNLQSEYNVSAIFKAYDLSLFDVGDYSRSNPFEERDDGVILATTSKDPLRVFIGSILRPKTKWI
jgi:hypothetical protein